MFLKGLNIRYVSRRYCKVYISLNFLPSAVLPTNLITHAQKIIILNKEYLIVAKISKFTDAL